MLQFLKQLLYSNHPDNTWNRPLVVIQLVEAAFRNKHVTKKNINTNSHNVQTLEAMHSLVLRKTLDLQTKPNRHLRNVNARLKIFHVLPSKGSGWGCYILNRSLWQPVLKVLRKPPDLDRKNAAQFSAHGISSTFKCNCVLSEITDVLHRGSSSIKLANLDVRGKTLGLPEEEEKKKNSIAG